MTSQPIPVACTLGAGELSERVEEWQTFFGRAVRAMARPSARCARFELEPSDATAEQAASLARREVQCCSFFRFALDIDATSSTLVVEVPDGAGDALSVFVEMLRGADAPPG